MNFYQFIASNLNSGTYGVVRGQTFPIQTTYDISELRDRIGNNFAMELFDLGGNLLHTIGFDSHTAYLVEEDLLLSLS